MESKVTTPVVKGLILAMIMIVFSLIFYFTGQSSNSAIQWIQYLVFFAGIVWACVSYAKEMGGNVTFGNVFGHGFKVVALVIAVFAVYTFISVKFIFPDIVDKGLEQARAQMESGGKVSDEQIDQTLEFTRKYFVPVVIGGIVLMFGIFGCIASLIGAAVAKKNPQSPFNQ